MHSEFSSFILHYGYLSIFLLVFLQECGLPNPIPNEIVLAYSGFLCNSGEFNFFSLLIIVVVADFFGSVTLFIFFYFLAELYFKYKKPWMPFNVDSIEKVKSRFEKRGIWYVIIIRITPFVRGYITIVAAVLKLSPKIYFPIIVFTSTIWATVFISIGKILGENWLILFDNLMYILIGISSFGLYLLIKHIILKSRKKTTEIFTNKKMTVNVCSDTKIYNIHGEGVSTSFETCISLLREKNDINVVINSEGRGDVMHSHSYGFYYFLRGLSYKGKKIHTVHTTPETAIGTLPGWRFLMPFFKWYFKKVYSFADICIAISPMVEKSIKDLKSKTSIVNIGNPIILQQWKRTEHMREIGRGMLCLKPLDFCVLSVGQLINRKGCLDFIEMGNNMPSAQFRWVGGRPHGLFSDGFSVINKAIKSANSNIKFAGLYSQDDMAYIYAAADAFVFPSYQENCPLAPLESAASGIPVVFRALPEYDMLYENEFLKAKDNDEFVYILKRLQNNKLDYENGLEMSTNLVRQFDKDIIREKLMKVYLSLMN